MLNYWGFTYTYMIFNEDWSRGKSWHNTISLDVFVTQLAGKSNCYEIKLIVFQIDRVIYSILRNLQLIHSYISVVKTIQHHQIKTKISNKIDQ